MTDTNLGPARMRNPADISYRYPVTDHDPEHDLNAHQVGNDWWVELRSLKTGRVKIVKVKERAKALSLFKGLSIQEVIDAYGKAQWHDMYKPDAERLPDGSIQNVSLTGGKGKKR